MGRNCAKLHQNHKVSANLHNLRERFRGTNKLPGLRSRNPTPPTKGHQQVNTIAQYWSTQPVIGRNWSRIASKTPNMYKPAIIYGKDFVAQTKFLTINHATPCQPAKGSSTSDQTCTTNKIVSAQPGIGKKLYKTASKTPNTCKTATIYGKGFVTHSKFIIKHTWPFWP